MTEEISPAQKKCKQCQAYINIKAKKCQHCSSDQRNWFNRHPVWTVIFLIIFVPSFISVVLDDSNSTLTNTDQTTPVTEAQNAQLLNKLSIVTSKIANNSIGTPELIMTVKNIGDKTIDAFTISVDLFNNFDEPVGQFNSRGGNTFSGLSQSTIKPGASENSSWNLAVYDQATKFNNARVTKIHFTDGTGSETK